MVHSIVNEIPKNRTFQNPGIFCRDRRSMKLCRNIPILRGAAETPFIQSRNTRGSWQQRKKLVSQLIRVYFHHQLEHIISDSIHLYVVICNGRRRYQVERKKNYACAKLTS